MRLLNLCLWVGGHVLVHGCVDAYVHACLPACLPACQAVFGDLSGPSSVGFAMVYQALGYAEPCLVGSQSHAFFPKSRR